MGFCSWFEIFIFQVSSENLSEGLPSSREV